MAHDIKNILEKYPDFKANIGIEIHVQLKTESKIFCSCPNNFGDKPNQNICPICAGYPGVLPVLNKKVVDFAIMAGLATNSKITQKTWFDRKHYMYPDLPKNYQITQDQAPICTNGYITIELLDNKQKNINLVRIHMEEDAGKNIHGTNNESYVDLNRAGTPLLEIVSFPDIENSNEAKLYLNNLKSIVQYLNISDANMEEGSFRGDVNISVRRSDEKKLGTKVELKNVNSFKFIVNAIEYEIERQINAIKKGEKIIQETRGWDSKENKSFLMRSKEEAQDYKYFKEPDLPILLIDDIWINNIKNSLPELPTQKFNRFKSEYNLSSYEAEILTGEVELANFFEQTCKITKQPQKTANWLLRNVLAYLNENKLILKNSKITVNNFAELILAIESGKINTSVAQEVFAQMANTGKSPNIIIKENNLEQIEDTQALEDIILNIIKNHPEEVKSYLSGKDRLFGFFVGLAMKETQGKANPKILQELLKKHLK
ncbi:MAG: Aspartyl/glutamyl-tRNA(Asn/Gln) amidotransferase subunit B [candidate division TM6 bacterium GW2011_GWF2_28_16]|nr:MAG: Aspartyl/glutamyl-tRNA(Asn/Gln) amidotransferase subunit B [candidate division TM6 bacterium GW2011_GWF2_28_16]